MEGEGQAAEHQAGDQGQQLPFFQLAVAQEQRAIHHQGTDDQHGSGAVDPAELEAVAGDFDGAWVELVDDEEQQKRDEIDELFHSGSQKRDVTA